MRVHTLSKLHAAVTCLETSSENTLFGKMNISEDVPVGNDDDDKRKQHSDADEEDAVVIGGGAVPQTLLSLGVELVRRPAKVVRQVDEQTSKPCQNYSDDSATPSKHCVVRVMPADVQVTIDGDQCDGKHRHHTADDTEAGCSCAQPLPPSQQLLLSQHGTFNTISTFLIQPSHSHRLSL